MKDDNIDQLSNSLLIPLRSIICCCQDIKRSLENSGQYGFIEDINDAKNEAERTWLKLKTTLFKITEDPHGIDADIIIHGLRNSIEAIIFSCDMELGVHLGVEKSLAKILRTAIFFQHRIENDLIIELSEKSSNGYFMPYSKIHFSESFEARILILDSSQKEPKEFIKWLRKTGYSPYQVTKSKLLDKLKDQDFDLVLIDIDVTDTSSLDLIRQIRDLYSAYELPIITMHEPSSTDLITKTLQFGGNGYLLKPINRDLLKAEVRNQLSIKRHIEELEIDKMDTRCILGSHLTDDVVDQLLESSHGHSIHGAKPTISVLFSDLRGFTSMAEYLRGDDVVKILNIYFEHIIDIVATYRGIINTFMGDGLLILFGAPVNYPDHADQAVACAVEMQQAMESVNRKIRAEGLTPIEMGIGINTGEVVAGNIGSITRTKYSVIGRQVNLAARIEGQTVGGQVLISKATREAVKSDLQIIDEFQVQMKGIKNLVTIYDVGGIHGFGELNLKKRELKKREEELEVYNPPLLLSYAILQGKAVEQKMSQGTLEAVSKSLKQGIIRVSEDLTPRLNLVCRLREPGGNQISGEVYGKVSGISSAKEKCFQINFTSIPESVKAHLKELID